MPMIKSLVRSAILSQTEVKQWSLYGANQGMQTGSSGAIYPFQLYIDPQLTQGLGDGQRVGDEVNIRSGKAVMFINLLPYNATTNPNPCPFWVRVWLVSYKKQNTNSIASTDILTSFFRVPSTSLSFQANMLDMALEVNTESWTVHSDKLVRVGSTAPSSTGPVSSGSYFDTSASSVQLEFSLPLKGPLKFNDSATTASNKNLWILAQTVPMNGVNNSPYFSAECHYNISFDYTDA
jgi:hypothetical protein